MLVKPDKTTDIILLRQLKLKEHTKQ